MPTSLRLIDLHVDWMLQYAPETTLFDPALYPSVPGRLGQVEGYLQGAGIAILSCYRRTEDWAAQADPWQALGALLTRIEAEFCGRLLYSADDLARCLEDPEGLCWGVIGVEGFDALIREARDLERIPALFNRGVRLFQPVYSATSVLAGSSAQGDERGLTALGGAFLETLADVGRSSHGPRPLVDLAHLNPTSAVDVLDWFESEARRREYLIPVYSHGAPRHAAFETPRALTPENLRRLRALGGVTGLGVGPPFFTSTDQLKSALETTAELPFRDRPGFEGIAIGTDFLGVDQTLPQMRNVSEVVAWIGATFDPEIADALIRGNGLRLIAEALGQEPTDDPES
jgi:membrane dipeptidase